jgi:hypothetical protein
MPTYAYTVQRNLDGTGANSWLAGDALANTGKPGNGYIHQYATAGRFAGSGPTMVGMVRTGTAHNAVFPRWAIGNLNGLYGYSGNVYGSAFGDPNAAWLKVDPVNGIRIGHAASTKIGLSSSGDAFFNEGGTTINVDGITLSPDMSGGTAAYSSLKWNFSDPNASVGVQGRSGTGGFGRSLLTSVLGTTDRSLYQVQVLSGDSGFNGIFNITSDTETKIRLTAKHGVLIESDLVTVDGVLQFPASKAGAPAGGIAKNATNGLHICPVTGSTFDFALTNAANSAYALGLKPGTVDLFIGGVPDFGGATSGTAGAVVGYLHVMVGGTARRIPYYAT